MYAKGFSSDVIKKYLLEVLVGSFPETLLDVFLEALIGVLEDWDLVVLSLALTGGKG